MAHLKQVENVLNEIVKSREAIKRKYKQLRQDKTDVEKVLGETFKPIVSPLEKLVDATKKKKAVKLVAKETSNVEELSSNNEDEEESQNDLDETVKRADVSFETAESGQDDEDETEFVKQSYLQTLEKRPNLLDNIYGIRIEDNVLKIGDSPIYFKKTYVKVQNENYPKTTGLLQLLFQKQPDMMHIGSNDIENYRKIVEMTNAFRRNYSETQPLRKSNSNKYKDFIGPYFDKSTSRNVSGSGLLPKYKIARKDMRMDYVYWDDPNELVDRLRLLLSELEAGNQSHTNEIHSIIEELKEAGYIH